MSQQAQDEHYGDPAALAMAYAERVNARGARPVRGRRRHVQLDEPSCRLAGAARQYGLKALNRALDGAPGTTAVHICFRTPRSSTSGRVFHRVGAFSPARSPGSGRRR